MPKPTRIGHLVINAKDLDAATKFYTDVIGFDIALERPGFGTFLTAGEMHTTTWPSSRLLKALPILPTAMSV